MSDRIRGMIERDGYTPVLEARYEETQYPLPSGLVGVIVVQDEATGKTFTISVTEDK